MKRFFILAAFAIFILAGCNSNAGKAEDQKTDPVIEAEISELDSISSEIDSLKTDIDKATEELDEIIDKL